MIVVEGWVNGWLLALVLSNTYYSEQYSTNNGDIRDKSSVKCMSEGGGTNIIALIGVVLIIVLLKLVGLG